MVHKITNYIHFLDFLYANKGSLYEEFQKQNELKEIIRLEKIETFFQPIVSLCNGHTLGFEILNRPAGSEPFPSAEIFFDYVGKSNDIFLVEQFLRNLSLKKFGEQVTNQHFHKDQLVFLNILPQVLTDLHFQSDLTLELLEKYHISPYQIVLELTEKEAAVNISQFDLLIDHYRAQGFRIAVDDAGTGYNSLKTLVSVKPEFIKLDKCLISNIDKHPEQQNLVELLIEFANHSDTIIIAEGIEKIAEYQFLEKLGVHYGQGFALGKPKKSLCNGQLPVTKDYYEKRLS